jgi:hypothetical protein
MIIARIILYERLDKAKLAQLVTDEVPLQLEVERRYQLGDLPDTLVASIPAEWGSDPDYMDALGFVVDAAAYIHEQGSAVFVVNYAADTKVFNLAGSYIRTDIDSAVSDPITAGTVLYAVFTTPGLDTPVTTQITLEYGTLISETYLDALEAVGIELNLGATGTLFSVKTQKVPYKVAFFQPADALLNYAIDFNMNNQTIEI